MQDLQVKVQLEALIRKANHIRESNAYFQMLAFIDRSKFLSPANAFQF